MRISRQIYCCTHKTIWNWESDWSYGFQPKFKHVWEKRARRDRLVRKGIFWGRLWVVWL